MALYGVLGVAESVGALHDPSKLDPFVDDGRLITVSLDLTGDTPEFTSIEQDSLREDDIPKLGYSHKSSGRGAKYSLTQIGSKHGNDAEGVEQHTRRTAPVMGEPRQRPGTHGRRRASGWLAYRGSR